MKANYTIIFGIVPMAIILIMAFILFPLMLMETNEDTAFLLVLTFLSLVIGMIGLVLSVATKRKVIIIQDLFLVILIIGCFGFFYIFKASLHILTLLVISSMIVSAINIFNPPNKAIKTNLAN